MRDRPKNTYLIRGRIKENIDMSCYGSEKPSIGRNTISPKEVRALEVEKITFGKTWRCKTRWFFRELQLPHIDENVCWEEVWERLSGEDPGEVSRSEALHSILGLMGNHCRVLFRERQGQISISEGALLWCVEGSWRPPSWKMTDQLY